jgi:alpha-glucosidase
MLLLTLRGTPTLYYGDELGLENGRIPPDKIQDPQGRNLGAERTRDVCRTPMQWEAGPHAGFSDVEPWLPLSADFATRNVAQQSADPQSLLSLYRRLLWYRKQQPALFGGSYRPIDVTAPDCFVFAREAGDTRLIIALNFAAEERRVTIDGEKPGAIVLSTYLDREERRASTSLTLRPSEGVIMV